MTERRRQMEDDMVVRGTADWTSETYLWAVTGLAKFYRRSPDCISDEETHAYLLHLIRDRQRSWSTCNIVVHSLRFFYHTTQPHFMTAGTRHGYRNIGAATVSAMEVFVR